MDGNKQVGIIAGSIVAVGLLAILLSQRAAATVRKPKFKSGDLVTGIPRLPTNVTYMILSVNLSTWTYQMAQLFEGQLYYPDISSIDIVDANYVLL